MAYKDRQDTRLGKFKNKPADEHKNKQWKAIKNLKNKFTPKYIQIKNLEGKYVPLKKREEEIAERVVKSAERSVIYVCNFFI